MRKLNDVIFCDVLKWGRNITKKNKEKVIRYGSEYGGWYLPLDLSMGAHDVCIAVGAGEDISFECSLAKTFSSNILIMDPTPRAAAHFNELCSAVQGGYRFKINNRSGEYYDISSDDLKKISYFQYGLSNQTCRMKFYYPVNKEWVSCSINSEGKSDKFFEAECLKYADFVKKQCIDSNNVKIVKMDIEGSEYDVIRGMIKEDLLPEVLCFEIHKLNNRPVYNMLQLLLSINRAGMDLVYVSGTDILFIKKSIFNKRKKG